MELNWDLSYELFKTKKTEWKVTFNKNIIAGFQEVIKFFYNSVVVFSCTFCGYLDASSTKIYECIWLSKLSNAKVYWKTHWPKIIKEHVMH